MAASSKSPGRALRAWREQAGPNRTRLTYKAAGALIGVEHSTWCEWEHDGRRPGIESAVALDLLTEGAIPLESWNPTFRAVVAGIRKILDRRATVKATGTDGR